MSIRIAALLACITGVLSLIWPLWSMMESWSTNPALRTVFIVVPMLSAVIAPVFYFALWQNKSALVINRRLRNLGLIASIIGGLLVVISAQSFIASVNQYLLRVRAFGFGTDPESIQFAVSVVGEASNIALVLLLIAFYKAPESQPDEPQSTFLEIVSRVDVMICGLLVILSLLQMGYAPHLFLEHRDQLARASEEQQSQFFRGFWTSQISRVLTTFCLFVAPYVVSMSRRLAASQVPAETFPERDEPGIEPIDQPS